MKTAVVTGASSGLGFSISQKLLDKGLKVYSLTRNKPQFNSNSFNHIWIETDLLDLVSITNVASLIDKNIDILINCAGVYTGSNDFSNESCDAISNILQLNLVAPILLTKSILPLIKSYGKLVYVNSVAGLHEIEGEAVYSASKHGLKTFANIIKQELHNKSISVSQIFPAGMQTNMQKNNPIYDKFLHPDDVAEYVIKSIESPFNISEIKLSSYSQVF